MQPSTFCQPPGAHHITACEELLELLDYTLSFSLKLFMKVAHIRLRSLQAGSQSFSRVLDYINPLRGFIPAPVNRLFINGCLGM